jgi:hypothetical protein
MYVVGIKFKWLVVYNQVEHGVEPLKFGLNEW